MTRTSEASMTAEDAIRELRRMGSPKNAEGMARFGIKGSKVLGVSVPNIRALGKKAGRSHELAVELWRTGIHEARLLASMVDVPEMVTEKQMDDWMGDFDSWDVVDQCCGNLFTSTPFAFGKALEWSKREREYEKRAGFSLMAMLAVHDRGSGDDAFLQFLPVIVRESQDERNFVKKAVNWSLRQIGKRNASLSRAAIETAEKIGKIDSRAARWTAADALRELRGEQVQKKLKNHGQVKPRSKISKR